jgi:hypothetical protein
LVATDFGKPVLRKARTTWQLCIAILGFVVMGVLTADGWRLKAIEWRPFLDGYAA